MATKLDTRHRCDRCGAQAYVVVKTDNGHELLFCGHHGKALEHHFRIDQIDYSALKALSNQAHASQNMVAVDA